MSLEKFVFMQAVMRGTLGISALQYRNASPMQAERCSEVPCANYADDEATSVARIAVSSTALRKLVMTVPLFSPALFFRLLIASRPVGLCHPPSRL